MPTLAPRKEPGIYTKNDVLVFKILLKHVESKSITVCAPETKPGLGGSASASEPLHSMEYASVFTAISLNKNATALIKGKKPDSLVLGTSVYGMTSTISGTLERKDITNKHLEKAMDTGESISGASPADTTNNVAAIDSDMEATDSTDLEPFYKAYEDFLKLARARKGYTDFHPWEDGPRKLTKDGYGDLEDQNTQILDEVEDAWSKDHPAIIQRYTQDPNVPNTTIPYAYLIIINQKTQELDKLFVDPRPIPKVFARSSVASSKAKVFAPSVIDVAQYLHDADLPQEPPLFRTYPRSSVADQTILSMSSDTDSDGRHGPSILRIATEAQAAYYAHLPHIYYNNNSRNNYYGTADLNGLPANVKYLILQHLLPNPEHTPAILLSPPSSVAYRWPEHCFVEPEVIWRHMYPLAHAMNRQLYHEVLTYYCTQYRFHLSLNCMQTPFTAKAILKWGPKWLGKLVHVTIEVDLRWRGGGYKLGSELFDVYKDCNKTAWLFADVLAMLADRPSTVMHGLKYLHLMLTRYKGYRPGQKYLVKKVTKQVIFSHVRSFSGQTKTEGQDTSTTEVADEGTTEGITENTEEGTNEDTAEDTMSVFMDDSSAKTAKNSNKTPVLVQLGLKKAYPNITFPSYIEAKYAQITPMQRYLRSIPDTLDLDDLSRGIIDGVRVWDEDAEAVPDMGWMDDEAINPAGDRLTIGTANDDSAITPTAARVEDWFARNGGTIQSPAARKMSGIVGSPSRIPLPIAPASPRVYKSQVFGALFDLGKVSGEAKENRGFSGEDEQPADPDDVSVTLGELEATERKEPGVCKGNDVALYNNVSRPNLRRTDYTEIIRMVDKERLKCIAQGKPFLTKKEAQKLAKKQAMITKNVLNAIEQLKEAEELAEWANENPNGAIKLAEWLKANPDEARKPVEDEHFTLGHKKSKSSSSSFGFERKRLGPDVERSRVIRHIKRTNRVRIPYVPKQYTKILLIPRECLKNIFIEQLRLSGFTTKDTANTFLALMPQAVKQGNWIDYETLSNGRLGAWNFKSGFWNATYAVLPASPKGSSTKKPTGGRFAVSYRWDNDKGHGPGRRTPDDYPQWNIPPTPLDAVSGRPFDSDFAANDDILPEDAVDGNESINCFDPIAHRYIATPDMSPEIRAHWRRRMHGSPSSPTRSEKSRREHDYLLSQPRPVPLEEGVDEEGRRWATV